MEEIPDGRWVQCYCKILKSGDAIFLPRTIPHTWKIVGTSNAQFIWTSFQRDLKICSKGLVNFQRSLQTFQPCGRYKSNLCRGCRALFLLSSLQEETIALVLICKTKIAKAFGQQQQEKYNNQRCIARIALGICPVFFLKKLLK